MLKKLINLFIANTDRDQSLRTDALRSDIANRQYGIAQYNSLR